MGAPFTLDRPRPAVTSRSMGVDARPQHLDFEPLFRGSSVMRCSRPLTDAEQREWIAGTYDGDIDSWTGGARDLARYLAGRL